MRAAKEKRAQEVRVLDPPSGSLASKLGGRPATVKAANARFTFPYLYDDGQSVARAYGTVCTPELSLFDAGPRLAYHVAST